MGSIFPGVQLGGALRHVTIARARQGQENDEGDEADDGDGEDAAFRAGRSAAEDRLAYRMSGEEMVLDHGSAVGDPIEEGLGPVPCGVEPDRPPQRAGAPETEAENHRGQAGRKQSDRRFTWILAVAKSEEDGQDDGGSPEAERFAVARFKSPPVNAREATRECVLDVAAGEVLLKQPDQEKAEQPHCPVTEYIAAKEEAAVDHEQSRLPQGQHKKGKTDDSPAESGEKVRNLTAAAQAVDGVGTALDLRHDPGDEEDRDQGDRLVEEHQHDRHVRGDLLDVWSLRVDLAADEVCSGENNCEHSDEDEQAPASAEAVFADEDLAEN